MSQMKNLYTDLEETMSVRSIRLDAETYLQLLAIADREDRTISDVMRQAMRYYVKEMN